MTSKLQIDTKRARRAGITLVEILIATALMGFVMMSMSLSMFKIKLASDSLSMRNHEAVEAQGLFYKLREDIGDSSGIDSTSLSTRLILRNLDPAGLPYLNGYRICATGGKNYLEQSTNIQNVTNTATCAADPATWGSAFDIMPNQEYRVTSGEFLYCGYGNNCTRFTDANADNKFTQGTDTATAVTGTALTNPSQARRIELYNFTFDREAGNPPVTKTMPNTFIDVGPRRVGLGPPNTAWPSTAGDDVIQWLDGTSASFPAPAAFALRGVSYDYQRKRLYFDHYTTAASGYVIITTRDGVNIKDVSNNYTSPRSFAYSDVQEIAWEEDGIHVLVFDGDSGGVCGVYRWNAQTAAIEYTTYCSSGISGITGVAIAYDPNTPNYYYAIGKNSSLVLKLFTFNKNSGGAVVGTPASLPAGLTNPTSMFMDPATGDFYVLDNTVVTVSGDSCLKVYRIDRANTTATDTFYIDLSKLPGASVASSVERSFSYDPDTNHLFMVDSTSNRVFEFVPPRLISPRS